MPLVLLFGFVFYLSPLYQYLPIDILIGINKYYPMVSNGIMAMKKIMVSLPDEMVKVLEKERKERLLETVPETIRVILSEYLRKA